MKLVTASMMRELDRRAIQDLGIPSLVLMENAGRTTYQILRREFPGLQGEVAVVAGRGNNGGDGFVVARYLANAGIPVAVFLLGPRDRVSGDARVNLEILAHLGIAVTEVLTEADLNHTLHRLAKAGLIVDALLGTGLNSPVTGLLAALIERLNHLRAPVLAVDMPTGLSADTGEVLGVALKAQVTVTYGWPKLGQVLPPGRDYVGRLWQVDISIPAHLAREARVSLSEAGEMRALLPPRPSGSHKGSFGHLLVLAGAIGKTGAAVLTAEAALRAGAGLVTLGIPASLNDILEVKLTEAMTLPLPEAAAARALGKAAWDPIVEFINEKNGKNGKFTVALGPGIGTHPETRELVERLAPDLSCPMVIDADGINNLAGDYPGLKDAAGPRILTPHPGEMARLVGLTTPAVQARRLDLARETAARLGVTLVLKGAQTVVAAPDGRASLNSTGNPALASGGTGDVLTGLIGGFLAQGLTPWDAARLGVYLHGLAADFFVSRRGPRGMIAGDLLAVWPQMLTEFSQGTIPPAEGDICFTRVIS
ncbi:MAG: NAD(P)H-hydrate dehydratase [Deltaproteobacteria bacterium]|nr:NAD(P)H-hydrate dehydratase [Deltaproteobacteria bacterium]